MASRRPTLTPVSFDRLAATIGVGFLVAMVGWPLVAIAQRSLAGVGVGDIVEILRRDSTWRVVRFTFWQAFLSALATVVIGLPIAHVLARYRFRGRNAIRVLAVVPFVLPTVVVAAALSALFDSALIEASGFGDQPLLAIIAAHVFFNLAVIVRVVGGFWAGLDRTAEEAAAVLGASPVWVFRTITLPRLTPVLSGAALVVFLFCFTSYGIILVLGGPATATLETEIRRYAIFRQEFDVAAVLAFLQLVVVVGLSAGSARLQRRLSVAATSRRAAVPLPMTARRRVHLGFVLVLTFIVIVVPIAMLIEQSLRISDAGGLSAYGLGHYRSLAEPLPLLPVTPLQALVQSLRIAFGAALVAGVVGIPVALAIAGGRRVGQVLEIAVLVPLGVSAATLGFGYLLAFAVFDLRRSPLLLPLAHAVVALPFVMASVVPALRNIGSPVRAAAATLGARPIDVLRTIDWPLARRGLATGLGFAVAVSIGEFGATSFISRGDDSFTAPLAVFRLLSQPGSALRGQAMALSAIIGIAVATIAAILERTRRGGAGFL